MERGPLGSNAEGALLFHAFEILVPINKHSHLIQPRN
jgi:hypothetical protein